MNEKTQLKHESSRKAISIFFLLTYLLSWPYFIIASLAALGVLPPELINLWYGGISAPMITALILIYRKKGGEGIKKLFRRGFKYKISKKIYFIPVFMLLPGIFLLALIPIVIIEGAMPSTPMNLLVLPIMFLSFVFSALGEELGWRGYAFDPMQKRWQTFRATLLLAIIWLIWHLPIFIFVYSVPPYNNTPIMILGQCLCLFGLEFILTWIYINTNKSIFTVILTHTMYNICTLFLPNFVPEIGGFITSTFIIIVAVILVLFQFPRRKLSLK